MKHIAFIWIPILIFMVFLPLSLVLEFPIPFDGAIVLLGASISGYTGIKSLGIYKTAKELPSGHGVNAETRKKMTSILIALYIIIVEAFIIQYMNADIELPLNFLLSMAGVCSAVVLGGSQAVKTAEKIDGGHS